MLINEKITFLWRANKKKIKKKKKMKKKKRPNLIQGISQNSRNSKAYNCQKKKRNYYSK
jgi:hypothetical protein